MNNTKEEHPNLQSKFCEQNKHTITIQLFDNKVPFIFNQGDYELIKKLFPSSSLKMSNYKYLSLRHSPSNLMIARIIIDLRFRLEGKEVPKIFAFKYMNKNQFDLRFKNLKIDTDKKNHLKSNFRAHYAVGTRLKALMDGRCPNAAITKRMES